MNWNYCRNKPKHGVLAMVILVNAQVIPALGQELKIAEPQNDSSGKGDLIEEITVIGVRSSALKALQAKKNSDRIVDSLRPEDIGKLPDVSIADSLARLPGVTVERDRGNGATVSVRGLGPDLVLSTLNGREVVTADESRIPNFQQFPSELINGADVFKAAAASQIEGGLAATIDLLLAKPLDQDGDFIQLSGRLTQNSIADDLNGVDDYGERLNLTYSSKFLEDTLGVLVGYARLDQPVATVRTNTFGYLTSFREFDAGPTTNFGFGNPLGTGDEALARGLFIPGGFEYLVRGGTDERDAGVFVGEWEPNDQLGITLDMLYSVTDVKDDQVGYRAGYRIGGTDNQLTFENDLDESAADGILFSTDGQALTAFETLRSADPAAFNHLNIGSVAERFTREDEFFAIGLNTDWSNDSMKAVLDLAYSKVQREDVFASIYASSRPGSLVAGATDIVTLDIRPQIAVHNFNRDLTDLTANVIDNFEIPDSAANDVRDELFAVKLDVEYLLNETFDIETGFRVADRKKTNNAASQFVTFADVPIQQDWVKSSILGGYNGDLSGFPEFLTLDFDRVLSDLGIQIDPKTQAGSDDLRNSWGVEEDTFAVYTQLNFETELAGRELFGNAGLRYVKTNQRINGFSASAVSEIVQRNQNEYVLPSVNLTLVLNEQQQLRAAVSQAIARPPIDDLRPGVDLFGANAFGGNPDLEPFEATQLDLAYEIYFDNEAALTFSTFYKDLDTFIVDGLEVGVGLDVNNNGVIDVDEANINVSRPINGKGGNVRGLELLYNQPFKFLPEPFNDLGVYATYAYTDSNAELTQSQGGDTVPITLGIRGLSRHVGVVTFWYSAEKFEASFSYRAKSSAAIRVGNDVQLASSEKILDFQTNYIVSNSFSVFFQASNLTGERFETSFATRSQRARNEDFGRFFNLGAKYRFDF